VIGSPRVHYRATDSTNQRARELAAAGAPHGTMVTADEQSAGRGRQGRTWSAPAGTSVLMSLIVRDVGESASLLPLVAAVAVCEAAESVAPVRCEIKWPNDVWVDRHKLAGILVEGRFAEGWAVVGIGLNVLARVEDFPPELRSSATSLVAAGGAEVGNEQVLGALLEALDRRLSTRPDELLDAWRARDALYGQRVSWQAGEGTATGIDDSGALIVDTDNGDRVTLDAGEVHLA
jgi:BirA family transcriptional regulator, biotin operon repressor / biotin---[acetyl-CoA-carboxylase] ligase